jgi:glyoxylase-like metal-dependent hydrolase (beta-lactamase superfamily II)
MKISFINTGYFKLDGGAMFGVVPKTLWKKLNPPDDDNLCTWAMRCLLLETGNRKILVDTGIGDKQDEKFRRHFHPHGEATLIDSLKAQGLDPEEITDVLLTHFHFDHVGGAVRYDKNGNLAPTFPAATYWTNEPHYAWAFQPNAREQASFLKENFVPLKDAGKLRFIDVQKEDVAWLPGINLRFVYGHTEAMMLPVISSPAGTAVYCADLLPSSFHLGLPYVMSYDVRPLSTLEEKEKLLADALAGDWTLIFEHDPRTPSAKVALDERGRFTLRKPTTGENDL